MRMTARNLNLLVAWRDQLLAEANPEKRRYRLATMADREILAMVERLGQEVEYRRLRGRDTDRFEARKAARAAEMLFAELEHRKERRVNQLRRALAD